MLPSREVLGSIAMVGATGCSVCEPARGDGQDSGRTPPVRPSFLPGFLPIREVKLIQPDRIGLLRVVSVLLIVHGYSVPARSRTWAERPVQSAGDSVQSDRLEQQLIVRCSLDLDHKVVPGLAHRFAGDAGGRPLLIDVVPDIPLMAASDPAFVSPDEPLPVEELVEIELQGLGQLQVGSVEVHVVGKVVEGRNQGVICVRQTLRRKVSDQVIVP